LNTGDAIPNTTKEVCNQIRLDPEGAAMISFGRVGSGDKHSSYHMVMEQLLDKKCEKLVRRFGSLCVVAPQEDRGQVGW
jgi:hypothetical protein